MLHQRARLRSPIAAGRRLSLAGAGAGRRRGRSAARCCSGCSVEPLSPALFLAGFGRAMLVAALRRRPASAARSGRSRRMALPDLAWSARRSACREDPAALTDADGALLAANAAYRARFDAVPPLELPADARIEPVAADGRRAWPGATARAAWRVSPRWPAAGGGRGPARGPAQRPAAVALPIAPLSRTCWRWPSRRMSGVTGERLDRAGRARRAGRRRGPAAGRQQAVRRPRLAGRPARRRARAFPTWSKRRRGRCCSICSPRARRASPLRVVACPARTRRSRTGAGDLPDVRLGRKGRAGQLDQRPGAARNAADRPGAGRSRRPLPDDEQGLPQSPAGIKGDEMPSYPGDLVVKEDKAAVADAVRRNARGPAMSGDLPVRLTQQPAEPVALTVAGLRGLGRCRGAAAAQGQ